MAGLFRRELFKKKNSTVADYCQKNYLESQSLTDEKILQKEKGDIMSDKKNPHEGMTEQEQKQLKQYGVKNGRK